MGQIYSSCATSSSRRVLVEYRKELELINDGSVTCRHMQCLIDIPCSESVSFVKLRAFIMEQFGLQSSVKLIKNFRLFAQVKDAIVPFKVILMNNYMDLQSFIDLADMLIFTTVEKQKTTEWEIDAKPEQTST